MHSDLAAILARLGLLDEHGEPSFLPRQASSDLVSGIFGNDGAANAINLWRQVQVSEDPFLGPTASVVLLYHLRRNPATCSLYVPSDSSFGNFIARRSLDAARELYKHGIHLWESVDVDLGTNCLAASQAEFLYSLSSGELSESQVIEALGKYAAAVARQSRWEEVEIEKIRLATAFLNRSIRLGNNAAPASAQLSELLLAEYDAVGDRHYLFRALALADSETQDSILRREILLKLGASLIEDGSEYGEGFFELAGEPLGQLLGGVGILRFQLVKEIARRGLSGEVLPNSRALRLPFGIAQGLASASDVELQIVRSIVFSAVGIADREAAISRLEQNQFVLSRPALEVVLSVLRDSVRRGGSSATADAEFAAKICAHLVTDDDRRHLRWLAAAALLDLSRVSCDPVTSLAAVERAGRLATEFRNWALAQVTHASAVSLANELGVAESVVLPDPADAWTAAVEVARESPEVGRVRLGGRSGVYSVQHARGELSAMLVFKPVDSVAHGLSERSQMQLIGDAIQKEGLGGRFGVPTSVAVVPNSGGGATHVQERQAGRLLSEIEVDRLGPHLEQATRLLALFHRVSGRPQVGQSGWRTLKEHLRRHYRAIAGPDSSPDLFVALMRTAYPKVLPVARKRDAHLGNWLLEGNQKIVACDLESSGFLPVGHDLAQLLEDGATLPCNEIGFAKRSALIGIYASGLHAPELADEIEASYLWFAIVRAMWIASSGQVSKRQHRHARHLFEYASDTANSTPTLQEASAHMLEVLGRNPSMNDEPTLEQMSGSDRRISRSMSWMLRHGAEQAGITLSSDGFASIKDVAEALSVDQDDVKRVARHPAEPRFELVRNEVRARYGHSLPITGLPSISVDTPPVLLHGTSWDALDRIVKDGLLPMSRKRVHLTLRPDEALSVGRRHGPPCLVAVDTESSAVGRSNNKDGHTSTNEGSGKADGGRLRLRCVADATWAAPRVNPQLISLPNMFSEGYDVPGWVLTQILATTGSGVSLGHVTDSDSESF